MSASDTPGAYRVSCSPERVFAPHTGSDGAQLSHSDGVPTSVSSVAIDPGLLTGAGRLPMAGPAMSDVPEARTDAEVMLMVKTGDESAFAYLVHKYRRQMVGFMYRMCHNPAAAEELAQEVFLRVYRSRVSYEASAKFNTWLYRIATNLAANHARDTRHERMENTVRLDEPDQETGATPDLADGSLTAEEQMLRRERMNVIRKRVQGLPERQKMAVIMHKDQPMEYRGRADGMKGSESTTKAIVFCP